MRAYCWEPMVPSHARVVVKRRQQVESGVADCTSVALTTNYRTAFAVTALFAVGGLLATTYDWFTASS
jgi:hypothetical protein